MGSEQHIRVLIKTAWKKYCKIYLWDLKFIHRNQLYCSEVNFIYFISQKKKLFVSHK